MHSVCHTSPRVYIVLSLTLDQSKQRSTPRFFPYEFPALDTFDGPAAEARMVSAEMYVLEHKCSWKPPFPGDSRPPNCFHTNAHTERDTFHASSNIDIDSPMDGKCNKQTNEVGEVFTWLNSCAVSHASLDSGRIEKSRAPRQASK